MANERFDPLGTLPANLNDQEAHDPYYEDSRAMVLSHYVMAERCLQRTMRVCSLPKQPGVGSTSPSARHGCSLLCKAS